MQAARIALVLSAMLITALPASAQGTVKVGLIAPMTGSQAASGRQMVAGAKLYMAEKGSKIGNTTISPVVTLAPMAPLLSTAARIS